MGRGGTLGLLAFTAIVLLINLIGAAIPFVGSLICGFIGRKLFVKWVGLVVSIAVILLVDYFVYIHPNFQWLRDNNHSEQQILIALEAAGLFAGVFIARKQTSK